MTLRPPEPAGDPLEQQIEAWRTHLRASHAIAPRDASELEDHLREQIAALRDHGLSDDEAFLVAVKRMGAIDALTREFAREHSDRLWKQLVLAGEAWDESSDKPAGRGSRRMWVALALAVAAGLAIKIPDLFGFQFPVGRRGTAGDDAFYVLNLAFFTLPFMAAYFAWERPVRAPIRWLLGAAFAGAAAIVNAFPFPANLGAHTQVLTAIHLPIVLWLALGVAYVGGRWAGNERRMDFVRFTGEVAIYFVLIAMGGVALTGVTFALFHAIGIDVQPWIAGWIAPCGFAGATVIASWLVEAKQSVIENMAPVLTRVFTPLFTLALLAFLVTMVTTGRGIDVQREILIIFDLLLVVVFGLLLYSFSARDPLSPPGLLDAIQMTLVVTALIVDVIALSAIVSRISEFGFTPNRVAALGENIVLLANLGGTALLYGRFLQRRIPFTRLWDWQTAYLYVFAAWAAVVAFLFPLIFGFR